MKGQLLKNFLKRKMAEQQQDTKTSEKTSSKTIFEREKLQRETNITETKKLHNMGQYK